MSEVITDNTDTLYAALREIDRLRAENDAFKAQRGEAVAFANFKEMELCMHRPADGEWTPVYTTPPAADALVEALEKYSGKGLSPVLTEDDLDFIDSTLATYRASQRKESTCR